jgi:hypothetical protein
VAAYLRLVADAAERETHKLSAGRTRNGFAETRLTHARRADETEDRAFRILDELTHGEMLQNAILDLLKPVVVFVQSLFGLVQVFDLFRLLLPGHAQQPINVGARNRALGGHGRHRFEAVKFLHGLLFGLFGHARLFDLLAQILDLGLLVLASEFLVDGLDLLVQVILFLRLLHLSLDARLNRAVELSLVNFRLQNFDEPLHAPVDGEDFQQTLLIFDRNA